MARIESQSLSVENDRSRDNEVVLESDENEILDSVIQLNVVPGGSFVLSSSLVAGDVRVIDAEGTRVAPTVPGLWMSFALTFLQIEGRQSIISRVAQLVVVSDDVVHKLYPALEVTDSEGVIQSAQWFSELPWKPGRELSNDTASTAPAKENPTSEQWSLAVASGYAGLFAESTIPYDPAEWLFEPWFEAATVPGLIEMTGAMPGPVGAVVPVSPGVGLYNIDVCRDDDGLIWACRIVFLHPEKLHEAEIYS